MLRWVVVGVCVGLAGVGLLPVGVVAQAPTPTPIGECAACFGQCLEVCEKYPEETVGPTKEAEKPSPTSEVRPKEGPTPCQTYQPVQQWYQVVGAGTPTSTPMPTPECPVYLQDPYDAYGGAFLQGPAGVAVIPAWRGDVNNSGVNNAQDSTIATLMWAGVWAKMPTPVGPKPTLTAIPTCPAGGGCTPEPTSTPWGGCQVTEAQGAEFLNGVQAVVILLAVAVPCLVASVTALVFLFFHRGR